MFWDLFWKPFGVQFGLMLAPGGSLGLMEPPRALLGPHLEALVFMSFFSRFWVPPGVPKRRSGGMVTYLWEQQKTPLSEEKWSKPYGKTLFWQSCVFLAQWKGGLLRGKVSQGSTSPLKSLALRG